MPSQVTVKTKRPKYPKRVEVRVGILEPGTAHEGGMTVGELAEIHEFGAGHVPARAPIRVFYDTKGEQIRTLATQQFQAAAAGAGDTAAFQCAADLVAVKAAAEIKNTISEGLKPGLAESTEKSKAARGISPPYTPLIETGVLKSSYDAVATVTP